MSPAQSFLRSIVAFLVAVSPTVALERNASGPCSALSSALHDKVSFSNEITYQDSISSYFFQGARLSPTCIVSPTSASDVSTIIKSMNGFREDDPKSSVFAIRSGGHTPFAGAANVDGGVTIDLRAMDDVSIDANQSLVLVGAGSIWDIVYGKLQPMNLTVLGARVAGLGVGGFLTGGGISFFSPERGFACDNIVNMEVVLANGKIVNANAQEQPDLFTALKGGSNNFGIVTRFDLKTYSQGDFWGGFLFFPGSTADQQLLAFGEFMDRRFSDPYAEMFCAIGYVGATESFLVSNGMYYTKPTPNPRAFQPFTSIQPQLGNTLRISNISDFVTEAALQQAIDSRGLWVNTVFNPGRTILQDVCSLWNSTVGSLKNVSGISYFLILQRLPAVLPGNSLGLDTSESSILCLISITWSKARDDALINRVIKALIDDIEKATTSAGLFRRYKYLNYAANFQDPIGSYGVKSNANLRLVGKKYDPTGLFQTNVPGGFKLPKPNPA
ncbi:MAG: hypothetical protein Q9184_001478 [Pyrenodesmia sp. 2 TL-2023]